MVLVDGNTPQVNDSKHPKHVSRWIGGSVHLAIPMLVKGKKERAIYSINNFNTPVQPSFSLLFFSSFVYSIFKFIHRIAI